MKTTVNQRVKILRDLTNLTQTEFATLIDVSMSLISKFENGTDTSAKVIKHILKSFPNINKAWFKDGKGDVIFATGTLEENLALAKSINTDSLATENTVTEKLYETLKEQIDRKDAMIEKLLNLLGAGGGKAANFLKALDNAYITKLVQLKPLANVSGAKLRKAA